MTHEEIHNIYLHMSGKAEGLAEASGSADFPVLFANAILEYAKRPWVGLTYKEKHEIRYSHMTSAEFIDFIEAKLRSKNNG